jgi:hypothetical protein
MRKILLGGLILVTVLVVLGAIGTVSVRSDTINAKNEAIATAQHEQAVANDRLTTAQQAAIRAQTDEAAAAAGQTTTAAMNPMVKVGLEDAWNNATTENQSSVCAALKTNPNDVARAAANGAPAQDQGIVTAKQVLEFYQDACLTVTTP